MPLLSPSKVENLIRAPHGCGEQTMIRMSPTAFSIRYLDKSKRWLELEAGSRDKALNFIEQGSVYLHAHLKKHTHKMAIVRESKAARNTGTLQSDQTW